MFTYFLLLILPLTNALPVFNRNSSELQNSTSPGSANTSDIVIPSGKTQGVIKGAKQDVGDLGGIEGIVEGLAELAFPPNVDFIPDLGESSSRLFTGLLQQPLEQFGQYILGASSTPNPLLQPSTTSKQTPGQTPQDSYIVVINDNSNNNGGGVSSAVSTFNRPGNTNAQSPNINRVNTQNNVNRVNTQNNVNRVNTQNNVNRLNTQNNGNGFNNQNNANRVNTQNNANGFNNQNNDNRVNNPNNVNGFNNQNNANRVNNPNNVNGFNNQNNANRVNNQNNVNRVNTQNNANGFNSKYNVNRLNNQNNVNRLTNQNNGNGFNTPNANRVNTINGQFQRGANNNPASVEVSRSAPNDPKDFSLNSNSASKSSAGFRKENSKGSSARDGDDEIGEEVTKSPGIYYLRVPADRVYGETQRINSKGGPGNEDDEGEIDQPLSGVSKKPPGFAYKINSNKPATSDSQNIAIFESPAALAPPPSPPNLNEFSNPPRISNSQGLKIPENAQVHTVFTNGLPSAIGATGNVQIFIDESGTDLPPTTILPLVSTVVSTTEDDDDDDAEEEGENVAKS